MINIGITQRVEIITSYDERRDCLDQRWSQLSRKINANPIPLANSEPQLVKQYIDDLRLDAIILSGGNSLTYLDSTAYDCAPERDKFELKLIKVALERNIPIIGVCRGMQILNTFFKGSLSPIKGHVGQKHGLVIKSNLYNNKFPDNVNSFHNWGITQTDLASELTTLATDNDGNIEAFCHHDKKLLGIMWHPERETPFHLLDLQLFKEFIT